MYTLKQMEALFNYNEPLVYLNVIGDEPNGKFGVVLFCDLGCENYERPRVTCVSSNLETIVHDIGMHQDLDHYCRVITFSE